MTGRLHVGTSGWNYDWPQLYEGVAAKRRLEAYAERLDAVELNGSFYRLQKRETYERWRERTPEGFCFAVKANKYLTHNMKLKSAEGPIAIERDRAVGLGDKLGAVLWQLPYRFRRNDERLAQWTDAIRRTWPEVRHVLEPRHESWFDDAVAARLTEAGVAFCMSDAPGWPLFDRPNTDFVYARLHGHTRLYHSRYSTGLLEKWAGRVREWLEAGLDVFMFFDNTDSGHAPNDAARLRRMIEGA